MPSALTASLTHPWRHRALIRILTRREVAGRYRGSLLGSLWPVLTPLLMLSVYTLVFGVILPARWPGAASQGIGLFALNLLGGLLLHGLLAETLSNAPALVIGQPNYVKKVVFPLEVLGWVNLLAALFHAAVGLLLLVVVNGVWGTGFALTQVALPLLLLPFALLVMGLGLMFTAAGVYLRDLALLVGPLVSMLMFLGPVFYPREAMPEEMRGWLALNPITVPIEQLRAVVFEAQWPDWAELGQYALLAVVVYLLGLWVFATLKRGFADVV